MKPFKNTVLLILFLCLINCSHVCADTVPYDPATHTLDAVEAVLKGTSLYDSVISGYEMTYGEAILASGAENDISPVLLASNILKETGGSTDLSPIMGGHTSIFSAIDAYAKGMVSGDITEIITSYSSYKTTANVNYRTGAGTSYSTVGTLKKGTVIQVEDGYSKSSNGYNWVRFKDNSGVYYVASEYLIKDTTTPPDTTTPVTPSVTYSKYKTTTTVNYRNGAGTSYTKMGKLSTGTVIEVEDGYSKSANGYTWVRFKNNSGTYYIASNYIKKVATSTPETPNTPTTPETPAITYIKYKTTTTVNYRNGAGTSYTKIGKLSAGTVIEVEDGYSKSANGYTWVRFKNNSGTYYIASNYIKKAATSTPETPNTPTTPETPAITYTKYKTTTTVNYRTGAGTSYSKAGKLSTGSIIEVENGFSKSANGYTWYRFKYNGGTYYIASAYIKQSTGTDTSTTPATTVTYTKYKTTTGVNYRSGAGTSYSKKGTLNIGTIIEVENGYSKSANGYTWYRFKYNGGTYYIASQYLKKA